MGGKRIMMVYMSHSKNDYGSDYINDVKMRIISVYGNDTVVIDPSKYTEHCVSEDDRGGFFLNMMDIFFPLISDCDVVVVVPDNASGRYTGGVIAEMKYAKRKGIDVWEM